MSSAMPDLAAALGGGYGGGADAGYGSDASAAPDDSSSGQDQFATSMDALDAAEQALQAFIQLDPDHADRAVAAQCLQNILKLKANNQQSNQAGDLTSLQRALQQGPAGPGGLGG